jgi:sulfhydrogenase subunit beta (sulfur reductase)
MEKEVFVTTRKKWDEALAKVLSRYYLYAPMVTDTNQDYQLISAEDISHVAYNIAKPATPLKTFFLPFVENLTQTDDQIPSVILGVPSCDLTALNLLDEIYLNDGITDTAYQQRRENTILIGTDCHHIQTHCHCIVYGVNPYPTANHDIAFNLIGEKILLQIHSKKGGAFLDELAEILALKPADQDMVNVIHTMRKETELRLRISNYDLPDYHTTRELIKNGNEDIWEEYAVDCVSCGACTAICPTCSCFLLVDKPGFEKLRHLDACQYPGFEKVAGGHDPLKDKALRFKNRYLCKYVWKPERFTASACTGCGRCIEACIGSINKNELFRNLSKELIK